MANRFSPRRRRLFIVEHRTNSGVTRTLSENGLGHCPFAVTSGISDLPTQSELDFAEESSGWAMSLEQAEALRAVSIKRPRRGRMTVWEEVAI